MTSRRSEIVLLFALSVLTVVSARKNFDCQVFEVDTQFTPDIVEHDHGRKWHCFPDPERAGERYEVENLSDEILDFVKGGGKWIHISGPFVNPAGKVPPGARISIAAREKNGSLDKGGRRTVRNIGRSSVLVIRASFLDSVPTYTAAQIGDSVFGDDVDQVNLLSQYDACSKGQLTFEKASGPSITEGVIDVLVQENIADHDRYSAVDAVQNVAVALVGSMDQFDHVMYCLPPGAAPINEWIAFGYYNWRRTVYNDEWCTSVSGQMHEFGHNLDLRHSGDASVAYGDQSGMMGYSYSSSESPKMCFNPAKSYQLGWFADCVTEITDPSNPTQRNLVGTADYQPNSCQQNDAVVLRVSTGADQQDLYVGYNKKTGTADGSNSGTVEAADRVTIVLGNPLEQSTIQADLGPTGDGSYTYNGILIKFCAFVNGKAVVGVSSNGADPCFECTSNADCDDGLFCTGVETCNLGTNTCEAGTPPACDDGVFCNGAETCDEATDSCTTPPAPCAGATPFCDEAADACKECASNADCDDELFCNGQEVCNAGTCEAGTPPTCDNGAFCDGAETCDEATDSCVGGQAPCAGNTPFCDEAVDACLECTSNADCADSDFCNGEETCVSGICTAGIAPCEGQFCIELTDSCVDCVVSSDCSDPTPVCSGNVCVGCATDTDCDNGLYCDGVETCNAGSCQSGNPVVCDNGLFCDGVETCNEATDACASGMAACSGGLPVCDEAVDACFECTSNADCDDGLFCTGVETCNLDTNTCEAGTPPACDDGVFCNGAETCDEATDSCTTPPAPCAGATPFCDEAADACKECASNADCDDELFCNGQEVCNAGTCEAGTPPTCDNGAFCDGAETCDEATDSCVGGQAPCAGNTPFCDEAVDACLECTSNADCDDGLFCTGVETCNLDTNTCEAGTPPACDDGVFCNGAETCDEATDSCTTPPAPCVGDTPFCDEAAGVCKTTAGGPTSTSSAPTSTAGQAPESTTQVQTTEEPEAPTTTAEDTTAAPEAPTSTPVPTTASECSWTNAGASPFSGSLDSFSMSVASGRTRVEFTSDATNTRPGVLAMYGPDSDPVESTCLTTGTLRGAFGAVSDGATNYLNNANCQWVIAPEGATAVTLVFESFDLERNYDYLKIYKCKTEVCSSNDRITLGSYTGSVLPDMHQSDAAYPYIMLHLETDYSVTQAGFRALYAGSAVAGCAPEGVQITAAVGFIQESAGAYSNSQHCTWDFGEVETTGLRLTFLDFDTEANKDFLSVKTCTTAGGPPVTTTQQAPEDPPQSTTAVPPAPLTTPGPEGDECTVFNAILGSPFSGTGSSQPPIVTANSIRVEFASDGSIVRPGFLAMYRPSADPPAYTCAQTGRLTGAWGEISDGPGEYLNNQVCEWIIESPPGSGVTLHFESFSIEDGYDMLHIDKCDDHACSNPQPLENSPFTGTSSPGLIFSDTAFLRIKMVTDFSVTKDGFKLTYTTSPISECQPDAVLANEAGFIRERAGNYVNNMQCSWEIQGSGSQIQLEFIEFSTEAGWDFVDIETCDSGTRRSGASRESHDADEARKEKIRLARLANPKQAQDSSGSNSKSKKLELKPAVEVASASAGKGRLGDQEKQERAARVRTNVMQMKAVLP